MFLLAIASSGWENFFQLTGVLLVFLFVLALTYFCTRWIAKYQKGINSYKNIRVIETFRITNNKYIQIIEVGEVYMAVAVCKDTISFLMELKKEQLTWMPEDTGQPSVTNESFQEILRKLKEKIPRK